MLIDACQLVEQVKQNITEVTVQETQEKLQANALIIDVREAEEYAAGHLPGAVLIPRGVLEFQIDCHPQLLARVSDKAALADTPMVLYCRSGGRSALAADRLQSMGYRRVYSMAGGFNQWQAEGLPVRCDAL